VHLSDTEHLAASWDCLVQEEVVSLVAELFSGEAEQAHSVRISATGNFLYQWPELQ
jgi:hypothetical protein